MKNIKTYAIIGIIVIIIILVIFFMGKNTGKNKPAPLPIDDPNSNVTDAESFEVRNLSNRLHNEMKGFGSSDVDVFSEYSNLSDRLFVAVYNDFNNQYKKDGDGTLLEWIDDEWFFGPRTTLIADNILSRMQRLNLQ
jgi:hypothetical protein